MDLQTVAKTVTVDARLSGFDESGNLPVGIHACSIEDLANLVRFNEHRRKMWRQLACFLSWPSLTQRFRHAFIGGGFISTKAAPSDIDVVLEAASPYGPEAFASVARFFAVGLERIEHLHGVHLQFWMQGAPSGLSDYRVFFQYDRTDDFSHVLNRSRGIVRVSLDEPDMLDNLRRYIRGEESPDAVATVSLREEAEKLQGVKRHLALMSLDASQVVIVANREGRVEWVNTPFVKTCGYTLDEVRGKKPGKILQGPGSDAATVRRLHEAVQSGRECDCRIVNYRKDGTPYLVRISMEPIFADNGLEGFVAIEEDLGSVNGAEAGAPDKTGPDSPPAS